MECPLQDVNTCQNWPIGVDKASCQMCWFLQEIYNRGRSSKFILPGTNGTFSPWLPPPGLSHTILLELRDALLVACRTHSFALSSPYSKGTIQVPENIDISKFLLSACVGPHGGSNTVNKEVDSASLAASSVC